MNKPETPAARNVPRLLRPGERPEPRESAWRNLVRKLAKNPVRSKDR
jgi:hypothetical protein